MKYNSEVMDDNKIQFLANEMTKAYMVSKTASSEENFIKSYYEFYENAKAYIAEREANKQKASTTGLSF